MKALFYLLDGATNASSRQRALQYFPLLRQNGIEPTASLPVPESWYQRLVERGSTSRAHKALFYGLFLARRLLHVRAARRFDVVVVQRDLFPFGPPLLERVLTQTGARLVYDTDDATYIRPAFTPNTPFQKLRRFDKVADVVSRATWVSVATEPIAAWARQHNANVSVVPMAIDAVEYDRVPRPSFDAAPGRPVVLGWAGTAGGLRYLEALAPVLAELSQRLPLVVRVVSGGYRQVRLPGLRVEAHPWQPETALADMAAFDIGLVPLDDSPFEQAKFPFKLLQFLALGVPSVSARVGLAAAIIDDGYNGLLAATPQEWRSALERLIRDADLRRAVASAGQTTVTEHYTVSKVGPLLVDGLRQTASRSS